MDTIAEFFRSTWHSIWYLPTEWFLLIGLASCVVGYLVAKYRP